MKKPTLFKRCRDWLAGGTLVCGIIALLLLNNSSSMLAQDGTAAAPDSAALFDAPTYSSPIALSADKNHIWVVNPDDGSVSVIGNLSTTPSVIANILNVGREPQSIALDLGTGGGQYRAYVANAAGNNVTVINVTSSNASSITAVVQKTLLTGAEPYNIVASPDGKRVFVANSVQDTLSVIDTSNQSVIGAVDLRNSVCNDPDRNRHFQPRGLAVTLNNDRLYVTRFLSFTGGGAAKQATDDGKVGVVCRVNINTASTQIADYAPAQAIEIGALDSGFKIPNNANVTKAYPNQLQSIVIRGEQAYLPNIASSTSGPLRFNVDTQAFVNVLDGVNTGTPADASATKFLNLHLGARVPEVVNGAPKTKLFFANPWAIAFTNQVGAGSAYVASAGSDLLVKVNVDAAGQLSFTGGISTTRYIDLNDPKNPLTSGQNFRKAGKNPLGLVIRENRAFVMNYISRNVSIVNLTNDAVEDALVLTTLPNPGSQDEQLHVGAEMFFASRGRFNNDAKLDRLSSEGWQNCASCHFAGLTDGNIWTFNSGPRKSIPLNGTWSPHNPDDQRLLNYSAIFDEVQDFELNIRNVSGPGFLNPPTNTILDPNHGLIISDTGDINTAPAVVNALIKPNAGRPQLTVTLPGSSKAWPALDSLKEWVRFNVRTPNGALTTDELTTGGGLDVNTVKKGRRLFFQAGCQKCHGGTKWTISSKDFTSPPAAAKIFCEVNVSATAPPGCQKAPPAGVDPNGGQFLADYLSDIKSFNLNVVSANPPNPIPNQPLIGAVELDVANKLALGKDHNQDGKGEGFNIPSLLAIWDLPPYYHNGACETLNCVLANPNHRAAGLKQGQNDPFADVNNGTTNQTAVVEWLKTLDADTPFPFDLRIVAHDLFLDPPTVIAGQPFTVGVNVSLFGTKPDLVDLLQDQGITNLTVRFQVGGGAPTEVTFPASAFAQDFGQAVVVKANLTAPAAGLVDLTATVDPANQVVEDNESNNKDTRRFRVRNPLPDTKAPVVNSVVINDDASITQSPAVKIKINATDPASSGGAPTSGLDSFCVVSYTYNVVQRRWVEQSCQFSALPAPSAADTFIVDANLQAREGVAYAFVWVKDKAGNISRRPGFDVITFIPTTAINLDRNDIRIFRISAPAGQGLKLTFTPEFGDVDVAVFDDFSNPNAPRIQVSANNGLTPEVVTIPGTGTSGKYQVEVRAVVNSRFTVKTAPATDVDLAAASAASPTSTDADTAQPTIAGPPAQLAAIDDNSDSGSQSVFLPIVTR